MSNKWDKWYYYSSNPKTPATVASDDISWVGFGVYAFGYSVLASIAIVGWQTYQYFRYGIWSELSVIGILQWCGSGWALNPSDWFGVYKMLNSFAFSLFVFLAGLIVLVLSIQVEKSRGYAKKGRRNQTSIENERARKRSLGYTDNEGDG